MQVPTVASGVHKERLLFWSGESISKLIAQGVIVSAASSIAVAAVAVLVVLTFATLISRSVAVAPARATRAWFFDTVISQSHLALLAIAFAVVIWRVVGFG